MMTLTTRTVRTLGLAMLLAVPAISEAGPPLICHPFETGAAALLPWGGGPGWNTPDARYDVRQLTGDTLRLLASTDSVLARMENLRRATIYATKDARIANELLSAVLARALASSASASPDPRRLFDAGYLIESYKQASVLHENNLRSDHDSRRWTLSDDPSSDGYALVVRAIALSGVNPEMEFAASLMKSGAASVEHRRRAAANAKAGSILAKNLAQ